MEENKELINRREFLSRLGRAGVGIGLLGAGTLALSRSGNDGMVWQIDPHKCVMCDFCASECVLPVSAVRCVHNHELCGYCDLCFGFFQPGHAERTEAAENQVCPTGAITRDYIEGVYYEYNITEELCYGCAKCVKLCTHSGNGSLFLQINHNYCVDCNDCAIARACPAEAISRIPAAQGYIIKNKEDEAT